MANPDPEIRPEEADGLAAVIATGRSDYPNQINNVLAFPGIFRGALDVAATSITEGMKLAAARAIAEVVGDDVRPDYIVPSVFDTRVGPLVAAVRRRGRGGRRRLPHRHSPSRLASRAWERPRAGPLASPLVTTVDAPTTAAPAWSPADLRMRRLLRLPVDAPKATEASARQLVEKSLLISMARCLLTYIVLPFVVPIIGIAGDIAPFMGDRARRGGDRRQRRVDPPLLAGRPPLPLALHRAGLGDHRRHGLADRHRPRRDSSSWTRQWAPRRAPTGVRRCSADSGGGAALPSASASASAAGGAPEPPGPPRRPSPFTMASMRSGRFGLDLGGLRPR